MNNKKIGNQTEKMFLKHIQKERGWACLIPSSLLGQPLDVVGIVRGTPIYVDIKHCSREIFMFSDIQPNQKLSMQKIFGAASKNSKYIKIGFVIYFEVIKEWRFYSYESLIEDLAQERKSISFNDARLEKLNV